MHPNTKRHFIIFALICYTLTTCASSSLPEDYVTDNEEQLARLKRENYLDSILKYLPFFHGTSDPQGDHESTHKDEEHVNRSAEKSDEKTPPLMSSIVSPSSFSSYKSNSIQLSSSLNTSVIPTQNIQIAENASGPINSSFTLEFRNTASANNRSSVKPIVLTSTTVFAFTSSATVLLSSSLIFKDNKSSLSNRTDTVSFIQFPVSSMVFSTAVLPAPSTPSPHSTSSVSDTAPLTSIPLRTVFSSSQVMMSAFPTTKLFSRASSSSPQVDTITRSTAIMEKDAKTMPVLPDEKGFGDKGYKAPGIENEKEVSFVYLNILLPIVSGISGALLITFSIMLFRCCRRRKLKKVRYFGGKPTSDFVRLDRMNLLTDTSDEEDFD